MEWQAAGGDHKKAKLYDNVIHEPVLDDGCDDMEVLDVLPPPELHLLLGVVYTLCAGESFHTIRIPNNTKNEHLYILSAS